MSALTEAIAASIKPKGPVCGVRSYIARLAAMSNPILDADEFTAAIADLTMTASVLSRALRNLAMGDPDIPQLHQSVIVRHRRGDCRCPR